MERVTRVLTDQQRAVLAPLIGACRPHCKTQPHDLRRTTLAIIWRCRNGAKWRSLPAEFGPWWMAAQTFIRPSVACWPPLRWRVDQPSAGG
jgi:transposase